MIHLHHIQTSLCLSQSQSSVERGCPKSTPCAKGGSALRRILLVLAVAALMAVMMVASAMPAFALGPCSGTLHPGGAPAEPDFSEFGPGADVVHYTCIPRGVGAQG